MAVHRMNIYDFESMQQIAGLDSIKHYDYCNLEMPMNSVIFSA